jgi:anti-sigma B factor antagonist
VSGPGSRAGHDGETGSLEVRRERPVRSLGKVELYYHDVERDVLVLKADGGLGTSDAEDVVVELARLVEAGIRKLIIDCSRVGDISSAGVGVLVRLHKKLAGVGGHVKVAAARGPVFRLLELTRLADVFEIYPTVNEALAALRQDM